VLTAVHSAVGWAAASARENSVADAAVLAVAVVFRLTPAAISGRTSSAPFPISSGLKAAGRVQAAQRLSEAALAVAPVRAIGSSSPRRASLCWRSR